MTATSSAAVAVTVNTRFAAGRLEHKELSPLLNRVYRNRGIDELPELDYTLKQLPEPAGFEGLLEAAQCVAEQLESGERIIIVGDFDADGATGCAVLMRGLQSLGAAPKQLDYVVPSRSRHGYGLSPGLVAELEGEQPALLITVDNGINAHAGVQAANDAGFRVLITDHHLPGETLPTACACANPKLGSSDFGGNHLAGVGVAFYLLLQLRRLLRERNYFASRGIDEPNLGFLLDLVAIGTVADMVELDHCNRTLVFQGIRNIRNGRMQPGVQALLNSARIEPFNVSARDLAFSLAPRLNAAGRLDDMSLGIECLLTDNAAMAAEWATELERINTRRKQLQQDMQQQAEQIVASMPLSDQQLPAGLCLYNEGWHEGVVGLVAGRLSERYHRPALACADSEGSKLKGSGRSVPGFHIRDALVNIAAKHPDLFGNYGGHAAAVGFSIDKDNFAILESAFVAEVHSSLGALPSQQVLLTDGRLEAGELNLTSAIDLAEAGPWGQGFPEPVFEGVFEILNYRLLREKHLQLELVSEYREPVRAIWFNTPVTDPESLDKNVQLVFTLEVNRWQGRTDAQLRVLNLLPLQH